MTSDWEPAFSKTELDPGLLSTPFAVRTAWHVITGAPGCGKTTLINELSRLGYPTVPELARLCIQKALSDGRRLHPVREDPVGFQRKLLSLQVRLERALGADECWVFDQAVPTLMAWHRVHGLDPNEMLAECFHHRYASVFILDQLPFRPDAERIEEMAMLGDFLSYWQARDYAALGYDVVRVPVLPPEERAAFVLRALFERR